MKFRSPLLGYNHNVRHLGRVYHVQTEDSGVNNPHLFTHLFHAGTIVGSRRCDYKPDENEATVLRYMQVQHKAMLKELRAGLHDERIAQLFGPPASGAAAGASPRGAAMASAAAKAAAASAAAERQPRPFSGRAASLRAAAELELDIDVDLPLASEGEDDGAGAQPAAMEWSAGGAASSMSSLEFAADAPSSHPRTAFDLPPVTEHRRPTPASRSIVTPGPPLGPAPRRQAPQPGLSAESLFSLGRGARATGPEHSLDEVILAYLAEDLPEK